jgi:hypothetical protein
MPRKLLMRLGIGLSGILMLGGCVTTAGSVKGACDAFRALSWHERDTYLTKKGIVGHNAAGKRICGWKPRK